MLKKLIAFTLVAFPLITHAQIALFSNDKNEKLKDAEPSIGVVFYDFGYISDTTKPENVVNQVMALNFAKDYAKFYSNTFKKEDSLIRANVEKQVKEQSGMGNINITNKVSVSGTPDVFMTDLKSGKIIEIKKLAMKSYLVSGTKDAIDWDIQDSTKKIGDYTCQKAIGTSKGRTYIAWFSTDLPYAYGPRRLFGLPGLILEAYDTTERIVYHFKGLEMNANEQLGIPENGIPATTKEYNEMRKAFLANPEAFFKSSLQGRVQGTFVIKSGTPTGGSKVNAKIVNFPIELTED